MESEYDKGQDCANQQRGEDSKLPDGTTFGERELAAGARLHVGLED
jgi:hypothetical protein